MGKSFKMFVTGQRRAVVKASLLAVFIIGAIYTARFSPLHQLITRDSLEQYLETAGIWALLALISH
jgi:hypothetical protein